MSQKASRGCERKEDYIISRRSQYLAVSKNRGRLAIIRINRAVNEAVILSIERGTMRKKRRHGESVRWLQYGVATPVTYQAVGIRTVYRWVEERGEGGCDPVRSNVNC